MAVSLNFSIIALNDFILKISFKRFRFTEQVKKQDPTICDLQGTDFRMKSMQKLKMKRVKRSGQKRAT